MVVKLDSRRKNGPDKEFVHSDDCVIVKADPEARIEWSDLGNGVWEAVCVCGVAHFYEPAADDGPRLDPLDPATAHHAGECEFRGETERSVLKLALKVADGMGGDGDYWWVTCAGCDVSWPVLHYAKSVG